MRPLGARLVGTFVAIDLMFKLLVGLAFIQLMAADDAGRRGELLGLMASVAGPAWLAWIGCLVLATRPIDSYLKGGADRRADDAALRRAGETCARLPLRLAVLWSLQWAGPFTAIAMLYRGGWPDLDVALFLAALASGPFPLAHALIVWLTAPLKRSLDLLARERHVELRLRRITIRSRLVMYAFCIAVAPSAYMAAIGLGARAHMSSFASLVIAIGLGFLAVAIFAVITALLVATTFTRPVTDMSEVISAIARSGSAQKIGRVPQHQRDEIGVLAELTNAMLERLERTETEREAARAKLEQLARTLERRVEERTASLLEAHASLERESLQRSKIELELDVARRIQTSILPRRWNIEGLDVAASMLTCSEVGGDYYDILPRPRGGWIGIGDVSGHGVAAGLIMLMLQSTTAALAEAFPDASTRDLVVTINQLLFENIRHRLQGNDFVTFTLLRYDSSGLVKYAGAHEELVVWRARTGTCERLPTPGTWIGVRGGIGAVTVESEMRLERDDLLVLYTDGLTEARGADRSEFGIDRLCSTVEMLARGTPVDLIREGVIERVLAFCPTPEDDISLVIARQT